MVFGVNKLKFLLTGIITVGLALLCPGLSITAGAEVLFDDSSSPMVLGNSLFYEIGISKDNGAIAYIHDKVAGGDVSLGNSYEDLWRLKFYGSGLIRSSTFSPGSAYQSFSYQWNAAEAVLTLVYDYQVSGQTILVTVTLSASESDHLDISATVNNGYGKNLETVYLPSELAFDMNEVEQFYFPYYEGVAFQRSFFQEIRSTFQKYQHLFTDFAALESTQGNFALYAIPSDSFRPATLGLGYSSWSGGVSVYHHMLHTFVADGDTWTSPALRLRVGRPILETLAAFRTDRGWDTTEGLQQTAGALFSQLAESFLVKFDCQHVYDGGWAAPGAVFSWVDSVSALLPSSALLHLVSFWPAGFDNYYPDYVPPNTAYGTEADLASIFENGHDRGQLVMPYTNPTWWDDESPTFDSLGVGIAVQDLSGNPIYECYGPNCGYVTCPADPGVRARIAQTVQEFTDLYPADLLFEDQVADRPWAYDTNPSESTCVSYTDGLLANAQTSSEGIPLATEGMLDALLGMELGFFDSIMLDKKAGWISSWGNHNWVVFPLTMLVAHDKAAFYQHNLAVEVMTDNKEMLTYNLAYGFNLGFDLTGQAGMLESEWLAIDEAFQRAVAARCFGKKMTEFEFLDAGKTVTRSVFENVVVIGNHTANVHDYGDHQIAPQGCCAETMNGKLLAGVFTRFNGVDLGGEHHLIQTRLSPNQYSVEQPSGDDVLLRLDRPSDWRVSRDISVGAMCEGGYRVDVTEDASTEIAKDYIQFLWRRNLTGYEVESYFIDYAILHDEPIPSDVAATGEDVGLEHMVVRSFPNPSAGTTIVELSTPPGRSSLSLTAAVYSPTGRRVKTLATGPVSSQQWRLVWDGTDESGIPVASGVYFLRIQGRTQNVCRKVILMR